LNGRANPHLTGFEPTMSPRLSNILSQESEDWITGMRSDFSGPIRVLCQYFLEECTPAAEVLGPSSLLTSLYKHIGLVLRFKATSSGYARSLWHQLCGLKICLNRKFWMDKSKINLNLRIDRLLSASKSTGDLRSRRDFILLICLSPPSVVT
jgi:hypothetical protein